MSNRRIGNIRLSFMNTGVRSATLRRSSLLVMSLFPCTLLPFPNTGWMQSALHRLWNNPDFIATYTQGAWNNSKENGDLNLTLFSSPWFKIGTWSFADMICSPHYLSIWNPRLRSVFNICCKPLLHLHIPASVNRHFPTSRNT